MWRQMDSFWNHTDPMLSHQQLYQLACRYPSWDQKSKGDCQSHLDKCPVLTAPILRIAPMHETVWACNSSLNFARRHCQLWSKCGCSTWKKFYSWEFSYKKYLEIRISDARDFFKIIIFSSDWPYPRFTSIQADGASLSWHGSGCAGSPCRAKRHMIFYLKNRKQLRDWDLLPLLKVIFKQLSTFLLPVLLINLDNIDKWKNIWNTGIRTQGCWVLPIYFLMASVNLWRFMTGDYLTIWQDFGCKTYNTIVRTRETLARRLHCNNLF